MNLQDVTDQLISFLREKFPTDQKYNNDRARDWAKRAKAAQKGAGDAALAVSLLEDICAYSEKSQQEGKSLGRSPEAQADYDRTCELIDLYHQTMTTTLEPPTTPLATDEAEEITASEATEEATDEEATAQEAVPPVEEEAEEAQVLDALPVETSDVPEPDLASKPQVGEYEVPLHLIDPNPRQPRTNFDPTAEQEMTNSIRLQGVLQRPRMRPIWAREGDGYGWRFELIFGERRFRSVQILRSEGAWPATIPAQVVHSDDIEAMLDTIEENRQRQAPNAMEEAWAFAELEKLGLKQTQIGERFKMSQPGVANKIRLLSLPEDVRALIALGKDNGGLSASHGIALCSLESAEDQSDLAHKAVEEKISKTNLEALIAVRKEKIAADNAPRLFDAPEPVLEDSHDATTSPRAPAAEASDSGSDEASAVDEDRADESASVAAAPAPEPSEPTAAPESSPAPRAADSVEPVEDSQEDEDKDEPEESTDVEDEKSEAPAPESGEAEAADTDTDVVESAARSVSTPAPAAAPVLSFEGKGAMLPAIITEPLKDWLSDNTVTVKDALSRYARLHTFAEGYDWTPEQFLDAIEGRDLAALETLQARLAELAMAIHDA